MQTFSRSLVDEIQGTGKFKFGPDCTQATSTALAEKGGMQQAIERSRDAVTIKIHNKLDAPKLVVKRIMADRGLAWIKFWIDSWTAGNFY